MARIEWQQKSHNLPTTNHIQLYTNQFMDTIPPLSHDQNHSTQHLILGDNLQVMKHLMSNDWYERFTIIYMDPSFDTATQYYFTKPQSKTQSGKSTHPLTRLAYMDQWKEGIDSYLSMLHPRLLLARRLLHDSGSLYLHLDYHVGHYVKVLLDEIFEPENLVNEIIWKSTSSHNNARRCGNIHQVIFHYAKYDSKRYWNKAYRIPYDNDYIQRYFKYTDPDGR
jgi:adenine-specific DNA-methyltransferase